MAPRMLLQGSLDQYLSASVFGIPEIMPLVVVFAIPRKAIRSVHLSFRPSLL